MVGVTLTKKLWVNS